MVDTEGKPYCSGNAVCDALRFLADASYAILPKDVAHKVGEMEKNFFGSLQWLIDKEIECIDARVAGGDRLREEWQRRAQGAPKESQGNGI
jgi:hypothetical protein